MNLKYYLRGLGIGIVMTALIMGISAAGKNKPLSDSEIIERAKALGMTEESTLLADAAENGLQEEEKITTNENEEADQNQEETAAATVVPEDAAEATLVPEITPKPTLAATSVPETTLKPTTEPTAVPTLKPTTTPTAVPTLKPTTAPTAVPTLKPSPTPTAKPTPSASATPAKELEGITIQVNSGDGSYTVCKKLEEAGLVDSASDFDTYLCEKGYDKRINVGSFTIPEGAEPDQIAKILARMD